MRLRRSVLITAAESVERIMKAAASEVDVCWIELEDGIHPSRKEYARKVAESALTEIDWRDKERYVRVNHIDSPEGPMDIAALSRARPTGFVLPKVQSAAEIVQADRLVSEAESNAGVPAGEIKLWCMIETAKALVSVDRIACASPRVDALFFGGGDLSADLQVKRVGLGHVRILPWLEGLQVELLYGKSRTVAAARAAGITAIDIAYMDHGDQERTYLDALYSFQLGFDGKLVISPRQVAAVHRAYAPSDDDLAWAEDVLATRSEANSHSQTVGIVGREMVDGPFYRNANLLIERHHAITGGSGVS